MKLVTWIPNSLVCKRDITVSTSSSLLAFAFICSFPSLLTLVMALSFLSLGRLYATPGIVARQAPLFMGFRRQGYRSGLPFPSSGDLPDPGIEPGSPALAGGFFTTEPPGKPLHSTVGTQ